jgi:hypothetical protein
MTLATKNGSIIVKDGRLAENCACCGGWYCCADPACASDSIASVTATVTIPEYLRQTFFDQFSPWPLKQYISRAVPGGTLSGTYSLSRVGSTNQWTRPASGCRDLSIEFTVVPPVSDVFPVTVNGILRFRSFGSYSEWDEQYKTASEISCTDVSTGSRSTPSVPGTLKSEQSIENAIAAYGTGGLCGVVPTSIDSGFGRITIPSMTAYGFSTIPQGALTVVQSFGAGEPLYARLQFTVVLA